jgi:hypothetical protein
MLGGTRRTTQIEVRPSSNKRRSTLFKGADIDDGEGRMVGRGCWKHSSVAKIRDKVSTVTVAQRPND